MHSKTRTRKLKTFELKEEPPLPPPPPPDEVPYFSRMVLWVGGKDRMYDMEVIDLKEIGWNGVIVHETPQTFTVRGQSYVVDMDLAVRLYGWFPGAKRSWWWSTFKDFLLPKAIKQGWLVYREPDEHSDTPVMPLDRMADQREYRTMTPYTNKAFTDSKLKEKYLKSTPFGGLLDSKVVLFLLLGLIGFVIIFVLSGGLG